MYIKETPLFHLNNIISEKVVFLYVKVFLLKFIIRLNIINFIL